MWATSSGLAILSFSFPNPSTLIKQKNPQHPESEIPGSNILSDQDLLVSNELGHWLITLTSQYCGLTCYEKLWLWTIATTVAIWWLWDKGVQNSFYWYSSKPGINMMHFWLMKYRFQVGKKIFRKSKRNSQESGTSHRKHVLAWARPRCCHSTGMNFIIYLLKRNLSPSE